MMFHTQAVNEVGDRTNASRFCRTSVTKFNRAKLSACVGVNCLFRSMTSFEKQRKEKRSSHYRKTNSLTSVNIGSWINSFVVGNDSGN